MKGKLTYKKKLLFALIGSGLFAICLYKISIADTIALSSENSMFEEQIESSQDAPEQIQHLRAKLRRVESLVGEDQMMSGDMHQVLLDMVTDRCKQKGIILKEFPQTMVSENNGYQTKTARVVVEGDFIELLKLVHYLETNYRIGKIVSVSFETYKEKRTRRRKLMVSIYIQNVKSIEHELKA